MLATDAHREGRKKRKERCRAESPVCVRASHRQAEDTEEKSEEPLRPRKLGHLRKKFLVVRAKC